jgi:signal transduction histidine kinase
MISSPRLYRAGQRPRHATAEPRRPGLLPGACRRAEPRLLRRRAARQPFGAHLVRRTVAARGDTAGRLRRRPHRGAGRPYFQHFYEGLGLGPGHVIALATRDAVLLARQPGADDHIGRRLVPVDGRSLLVEALAQAPAGTFDAVSPVDRTSRIFGYRTFAGHPLVVLVGLSREQVLAPWSRAAAAAAALTVAIFALAALLLWLAMRYARRDARAQARADEVAKLEALGRLTSGVAHDFNNLLQATTLTLSLLGNRTHGDALAAELIEQSLTSMEDGRDLVAQLLGVARPQQVLTQSVDVNALLAGRCCSATPPRRHRSNWTWRPTCSDAARILLV